MPTYTYLCRCGHRFDRFELRPDKEMLEKSACPNCGSMAERNYSGPAPGGIVK